MHSKKVMHFSVNIKSWSVKQRIINAKRAIYDNCPFNDGINLPTKTKQLEIKFTPDVKLMGIGKEISSVLHNSDFGCQKM